MNHYIRDIYNFHKAYIPNTWISYPEFHVYVRKGTRKIPGFLGYQQTFDVANITVEEAHRGKGLFTWWLGILETEAKHVYDYDGIYVENVLNDRLREFLRQRGYTSVGDPTLPSFYLKF
jgi:GNAT superfamily N-acetyltransferase